MTEVLDVFRYPPYALPQAEKERVLLGDLRRAVAWHTEHCPPYRALCESRSFDLRQCDTLEDIPYLPVTLFKSIRLRSVPESEIVRTLFSSSTSGRPSTIVLDEVTMKRQQSALVNILLDFFGSARRQFFIFDTRATLGSSNNALSSRATAMRGMLPMAKRAHFLLNPALELDHALLAEAFGHGGQDPVLFFGFTWLLYQVYERVRQQLADSLALSGLSNDRMVLHLGGWKKLTDRNVKKSEFNSRISTWLKVAPERIVDLYGMTEQLGTVYPDCVAGFKHAPVYSDILIRDPASLAVVPSGSIGFIELVSPLPHSYPGIAVLSDDLGKIVGVDDCTCGRKGKYFVFEKRSEAAELKGCGDTVAV